MALAVNPNPDPDRKPTIGERLDAELGLNEDTLQAISEMEHHHRRRIEALEATVSVLEALLLGEPAGQPVPPADDGPLAASLRQLAIEQGWRRRP